MKNKPFFLYCIGRLFFSASNVLYIIMLQLAVYRITGNGSGIALLSIFRNAPLIIVGPFAGFVVDRFSKRIIEVVGLGFMALMILFSLNSVRLFPLYCASFLYMLFWTFVKPSFSVSISLLNTEESLVSANSTVMIIDCVLGIIVAAGYSFLSERGIIVETWVLLLLMLLSALCFSFVHEPIHLMNKCSQGTLSPDKTETSKLFFSFLDQKLLLFSVIVALIWFSIGSFSSVQLFIIVKLFQMPDYYLGYFNSIQEVGSVVGLLIAPVLVKRFIKNKNHVMLHGYLYAGILVLLLLFKRNVTTLPLMFPLIIMFLYSMFIHMANAIEESYEQMIAPVKNRGKAISFISAVGTLGYLVSMSLMPFLSDFIDLSYIIIIASVSFLITSYVIYLFFRHIH